MFECQVYSHKKGRWKSFSMHISWMYLVCMLYTQTSHHAFNTREDADFFHKWKTEEIFPFSYVMLSILETNLCGWKSHATITIYTQALMYYFVTYLSTRTFKTIWINLSCWIKASWKRKKMLHIPPLKHV